MTYCVATLLDTGLVFLSDSRTNAGVDHINTFRKMHVFEKPGDRVLVLMTSGNLAVAQSTLHLLHEQITHSDTRTSLFNVHNLFEAASLVGEALREVHRRDAPAFREHGIDFNASFILGGQIAGEPPRLFNIYAAGNFIEATLDTPYFQIGESKYGKPIVDRVITRSSSLAEAVKCALISMDSTIRSNLSVGPPLDLVCIRRDALQVLLHRNIGADDDYFRMIRSGWSDSLRHAFHALPNPDLKQI
ncbi:MAG: proteasome-type protease [Steroidobacteraceae bacterium]